MYNKYHSGTKVSVRMNINPQYSLLFRINMIEKLVS